MHLSIKKYALVLLLLQAWAALAQQYNFINFNVEDGLLQSQATALCQDSARHLWVGTLGGVSRFDGRSFTHFTKMEGLAGNTVTTLFCDREGQVWVGTTNGLSVFDGKRWRNARISSEQRENIVQDIVQGWDGRIQVLAGLSLFRLNGQTFERQKVMASIEGNMADTITTLDLDGQGQALVAVYGRGIFAQKNGAWVRLAQTSRQTEVRQILVTSWGDTLLATNQGLQVLRNTHLTPFVQAYWQNSPLPPKSPIPNPQSPIVAILQTSDSSLWVATLQGALQITRPAKGGEPEVLWLNQRSGLTDHLISAMLKDAEGSLWLASDVGGLFRFNGFRFTHFDEVSGLRSPIVMGIVEVEGEHFFASHDGGLAKMSDGKISPVTLPPQLQALNCLGLDQAGKLLLGTRQHGLWRYDQRSGQTQRYQTAKGPSRGAPTAIHLAEDGRVWVGSGRGFFSAPAGSLMLEKEGDIFVTDIRQYGKDTLLLSTGGGAYLFDIQRDTLLKLPYAALREANGLCAAVFEQFVFYGSTDRGLFALDKRRNTLVQFTRKEGLPSNFIYNILAERVPLNMVPPPLSSGAVGNSEGFQDARHQPSSVLRVWLGTGYGIACLILNEDLSVQRVVNYGKDDGLTGMESNHNASFKDSKGHLWFGLTKGLFRLQDDPADKVAGVAPVVSLRSVALFSKTLDSLPNSLRLRYDQNHLAFELGGICLRNPESLFYKYRLEGLDEGFTFSPSGTATYPSLPPGSYEFVAYALTPDSLTSKTPVRFRFEIEAPFYRKGWFLTACYGALLLTVLGLGWLRHRSREQKRLELERLRTEEFNRLRRRTAEDFHDEMGNKLTRIAVLSDILNMRLHKGSPEASQLVEQIKDNVAALHSGSRDIIWSLNPGNDELEAVVRHIGDIGRDLFSETETEFVFQNLLEDSEPLALPISLDLSRNLQMIAKEIFANALRHAHASQVVFEAKRLNAQEFLLSFSDNGRGFDPEQISAGNGLRNLRSRAERIGARLEIQSENGTRIELKI